MNALIAAIEEFLPMICFSIVVLAVVYICFTVEDEQ